MQTQQSNLSMPTSNADPPTLFSNVNLMKARHLIYPSQLNADTHEPIQPRQLNTDTLT